MREDWLVAALQPPRRGSPLMFGVLGVCRLFRFIAHVETTLHMLRLIVARVRTSSKLSL